MQLTVLNISIKQVSKLINSLKEKGFIDVNIIYKNDSKQIDQRELVPIIKTTYPAKVQYPMEQKDTNYI